MDRVFVIFDKNNTNPYFIFSVALLSLFFLCACTCKCRGMADCWIDSIFFCLTHPTCRRSFSSFARLVSAGARFSGWTYVRHSSFFFARRFVGSSELFRQDFRPPLVFLLSRMPPPPGARNNQPALLDRGFVFFIAVDGVSNNQPFVSSFPIRR